MLLRLLQIMIKGEKNLPQSGMEPGLLTPVEASVAYDSRKGSVWFESGLRQNFSRSLIIAWKSKRNSNFVKNVQTLFTAFYST